MRKLYIIIATVIIIKGIALLLDDWYATDAVWSAIPAIEMATGKMYSTIDYVPESQAGLLALIQALVIKSVSFHPNSLHLYYSLIWLLLAFILFRKYRHSSDKGLFFLVSILFHPYIYAERPECAGILFILSWYWYGPPFKYKNELGVMLSFLIHPLAGFIYLIIALVNKWNISYPILLLFLALITVIYWNNIQIWLSVWYQRIFQINLNFVKDTWWSLCLILIYYILHPYSRKNNRQLYSVVIIYIVTLGAGKPYYSIYAILPVLLYFEAHTLPKAYFNIVLSIGFIFISVIQPTLSAETRKFHQSSHEKISQYIRVLSPDIKVYIPVNLLPYIWKRNNVMYYIEENGMPAVRKGEILIATYLTHFTGVGEQLIPPVQWQEWNLFHTRRVKKERGLVCIRP